MLLKAWFPVGQHYKVAMTVDCHNSVPVLMLLGRKTTTTKQTSQGCPCQYHVTYRRLTGCALRDIGVRMRNDMGNRLPV